MRTEEWDRVRLDRWVSKCGGRGVLRQFVRVFDGVLDEPCKEFRLHEGDISKTPFIGAAENIAKVCKDRNISFAR